MGRQQQLEQNVQKNRDAQEELLRRREELIQELELEKDFRRQEKDSEEGRRTTRIQELNAQVGSRCSGIFYHRELKTLWSSNNSQHNLGQEAICNQTGLKLFVCLHCRWSSSIKSSGRSSSRKSRRRRERGRPCESKRRIWGWRCWGWPTKGTSRRYKLYNNDFECWDSKFLKCSFTFSVLK